MLHVPKSEMTGTPMRIGEVLISEGKLTPEQAEAASVVGAERNILFGQAVVLMGFATVEDVKAALSKHLVSLKYAEQRELSDDIAVLKAPNSQRATDMRRLALNLATRWFRGESKHPALSIISAGRGEGRSTVAANLACTFATAGVRTLLVDADLHHPSIQEKFGLVSGAHSANGYYSVRDVNNLMVIPAAALFDVEYDRFMQSAFAAMISAKSSEFDVIFVDTPAASISNEYQLAGLATAGALVVTREGKSTVRQTSKMISNCDDAGIPIVGGVMLKA